MGKKWKQWQTIFLGSKITVDGDCGHEIKRHLLLGRKAMTNLDSTLQSRDITLLTNVHIVSQSYGFSSSHVQMWELDHKEGWELKNWCFGIVMLEKTLENRLNSKRSNWSIWKEISTLSIHWKDWCWSWSSKTLPTWCEEPTHWKRPWCWERLKAGGEGICRGWDDYIASLTQWTWIWAISRSY